MVVLDPRMDPRDELADTPHSESISYVYVVLGFGLVDLVRFELTTSSMPWKADQSDADSRTRNKRLARQRFGRHLDAVTSSTTFRTPPDSGFAAEF